MSSYNSYHFPHLTQYKRTLNHGRDYRLTYQEKIILLTLITTILYI
jgi:hypothetical protein